MNTEDIKFSLESSDLPEVRLPRHQRRLRMAILSSWRDERSSQQGRWGKLINYFTMSKKHLAYGTAIIAVVALGIFGGVLFQNGTPQAKADELVKSAITVVSSMTSADLAELMKDKDFDLMASLKEAQQAKDLTTLTPEQFAKEDSNLQIIGGIPENIKYLKYTDAAGNKVYLGLDENNIPHFKNMLMKDGTKKGYGEATIVGPLEGPVDGNTDLPVINPDDLNMVPVGEGIQVITGSAEIQE